MVGDILRINELHFKLLIPVWGETYLNRFLELCSKSLLSADNLLLLKNFKTHEIVFLTTKSSEKHIRDYFKNKNVFLNIIYIDDLLACNSYGIILTLAYTRGILTSTTKQLETAFMFLNADLLLSNNTISLIINKLNSGYDGVLSLGMRCIEEEVSELINNSDLSSRSLVDICFKHMHPTMAANVVNQDLCYSTNNLAIHLKTESSCLLTISFNPYMLCIKPEVELKHAEGYCDFYFVPAMLPSCNYYYVCDSDEMFMLEIAPEQQEKDLIRDGSIINKEITNWMSLILMKDKLKYAEYIHIMHNSDVNENLDDYKRLISNYFDMSVSLLPKNYFEIYSRYNEHPFWLYPVNAFIEKGVISGNVFEINTDNISKAITKAGILEKQRQRLISLLSEEKMKFKLQDLLVKNMVKNYKSFLLLTDDMSKKHSVKDNELYFNVREFLNLADVTTILSPFIKHGTVRFIISTGTFDFYRNKIKRFIHAYKDVIHVEIHLESSSMDRDVLLKYVSALLFDIKDIYINIRSVSEYHTLSILKVRIRCWLYSALKSSKDKLQTFIYGAWRVFERYAPRKIVCFVMPCCKKLKYKVMIMMGSINKHSPVLINKYQIIIATHCPVN